MSPSVQHCINTVIASLQKEVLPHLDPAATPASSLRACLMILTHAEQRLTLEAKLLFEDNNALRALLAEGLQQTKMLGLDDNLRDSMAATLQQYQSHAAYVDSNDAALENQAYQELLTQLIKQLANNGAGSTKAAADKFRTRLHPYLAERGQRDFKLVEKALAMVPV